MQRDELRRACTAPRQRAGLRADPELVEALVADVEGAPGALPMLSTALLELWQHRDGRRLRHGTYAQTGGVRGAVARLAEQAFAELGDAQQTVAESVLMRLVDPAEGDAVERRRVALEELEVERDQDVARVVALLTDRRLLTVDAGTIEIAHEALLREWPRLRRWIEHNREVLRIQRAVREAAGEWERLDRDDGALLRGARLAEAIDWRDGHASSLTGLERGFLLTSEAARQSERATRRRRMVLAFGSLAVALLVISIVAIVSIVQGRRAASRELANRSEAVLANDPGLALAIGLEALKRSDTPEAQNALRQATVADRSAAIMTAHESAIYRAALSPDEARLATAGDDGTIRIVDLRGARVGPPLKRSALPLTDVAFSPDGKHVASTSVGGEVAISQLDGRGRRVALRLPGDPGAYPRSVEYDPAGRRLLVTVYGEDAIRLVGVEGRSSVLAGHPGVRVARFSPHGDRVLSAGEDGQARIWDLAGNLTASMRHGSDIYDARFSPDGRFVATAGADGAIRLWSARTGGLVKELALDLQPLYSVRFSTDGDHMVAGGADGVVRVVNVRGGSVLAELKGHSDRVYDAGFVGDGDALYSVGTDGTVRTWRLLKTEMLPAGEQESPSAPSFSPDGKLVVSGYLGGRVRIWNPATNAVRQLPRHKGYSVALYSGNGAYVLTSGDDEKVRLYDVERQSSVLVPVDPKEIFATAIDETGRRVAVAGDAGQGERTVLQAPDGRDRVLLPPHGQAVSLAFSPNAKQLLSASQDGTVRIWNAATGALLRSLKAGEGGVLQAQFSPDGTSVAAAGADGTVRIWHLDGGDSEVLYGHDGPVTSVDFNDDGSQIVSGGKDGTVRVWDVVDSDRARVVLSTRAGEITGVALRRDGRVMSGASDGIVVAACEVCGSFDDVLARASARPRVKLDAAERARLEDGG